MTHDEWTEANNRYLAASLQWLRELLHHFSEGGRPQPGEESARPPGRSRERTDEPACASSRSLVAAAAARGEAATMDPAPALVLLARRMQLSDFERDTLLLCAANEFDPSFADRYAAAQGNPARAYPTFSLALTVLDDPSWDALSPHRPLRSARLLEINQPGATPLTAAALRADERVVNFIKGLNEFDDRLAPLFRQSGRPIALSASQEDAVGLVVAGIRTAIGRGESPVIQLLGPDPESKLAVANEACEAFDRRLHCVDAEALPAAHSELESLSRLWERETRLLPVALYVDAEHAEASHGESTALATLQRFLGRAAGLVFIGLREAPLRLPGSAPPVEIERPTPTEQHEVWSAALADDAEPDDAARAAELLAGQYRLNLRAIRDVAAQSAAESGGVLHERLWRACREITRPRIDELAQRLHAKATWSELVLPDEPMKLMRQIAGQVRERHRVYTTWGFDRTMNRGFGISALFAGESGTGKTMAAEVLANDLGLNLYRIDLSAVVSKYIGETEKNLRRLFDAAEQGGAILFFDEADALFGKRSEVRDSHDRYANIEINYLLQRIEAFSGLAILATNLKSAIDQAFLRRLRFLVGFQFPGARERRKIWERALPPDVPREDLDFERLARMSLTGGAIHNIALNAAFLAAQARGPVTMQHLFDACRDELRKLDKPVNEAELRPLELVNGRA